MLRVWIVGSLALALVFASGCGSPGKAVPAGMVSVTGVVTMDGQPLSGATVMFIPMQPANAMGAGGVTDSSGKYTLTSGEGSVTGALPGTYKVVVSCLKKADGSPVIPGPDESPMQLMIGGAKEHVPDQYSNPVTSKLIATVDSSGSPVDFKLTSK